MPVNPIVFVDAQNRMARIVRVDTSIGDVLVEARVADLLSTNLQTNR